MFTGLIQTMGTLASSQATPSGKRLEVETGPRDWGHEPRAGDSIAVNGVCLTLVETPDGPAGRFLFDAVPETLSKTTLGVLAPGARVHVEHAATPTTLLGGHIVQGHVDGVGRVVSNGVRAGQQGGPWGSGWVLEIACPPGTIEYMIPKGSVAVEGVSLTLAAVDVRAGTIQIALIPTTLAKTTLENLKPGDGVNIECDATAKTVVHYMKEFLRRE
jgi:riboflavin synthase